MAKIRAYFTLFFLAVLIFLVASVEVIAKVQIWHGYIIDRKCASTVKVSGGLKSFVEQHTTDCLLMCKDRGYSLYSEGKWIDLDTKGNQLVLQILQNTQKERGLYVEIIGIEKNNVLTVQSIKEINKLKSNDSNGVNYHVTY